MIKPADRQEEKKTMDLFKLKLKKKQKHCWEEKRKKS
jgi:hypothetical protein